MIRLSAELGNLSSVAKPAAYSPNRKTATFALLIVIRMEKLTHKQSAIIIITKKTHTKIPTKSSGKQFSGQFPSGSGWIKAIILAIYISGNSIQNW